MFYFFGNCWIFFFSWNWLIWFHQFHEIFGRLEERWNHIILIGLNNFNPIGLSPCIKLSNFFCCRIWIHHVWLGLALLLYITDINNSEPQEHHTIRHKKGVKTRKQVPGGRGEGACAQHGPPACLARNKMNLMLCSIDKKRGLTLSSHLIALFGTHFFPLYEILIKEKIQLFAIWNCLAIAISQFITS